MRFQALSIRLDETLDKIESPRQLVGHSVPDEARSWAEEHNLEVIVSEFAPRGQLFLIGAIPVPDIDPEVFFGR